LRGIRPLSIIVAPVQAMEREQRPLDSAGPFAECRALRLARTVSIAFAVIRVIFCRNACSYGSYVYVPDTHPAGAESARNAI